MAIAELAHWNEDPEFRDAPPDMKARVYQNYFDKEMADDEFRSLPQEEQSRIKSNFLGSAGLSQSKSTFTTPTSTPKQATALKDSGYIPPEPVEPTPQAIPIKRSAIPAQSVIGKWKDGDNPEVDVELNVPSLTDKERGYLLNMKQSGNEPTYGIFKKALAHLQGTQASPVAQRKYQYPMAFPSRLIY